MRKRIVILGGCVVLFVGILSTQTGHLRAGLAVKSTDTPEGTYEYYYTDGDSEENGVSGSETDDSQELIEVDTTPDSYTVLVNREYPISKDYVPDDLVVPDVATSFYGVYEKSYVRKRAASALEDLFAGAAESGYTLKLVSAYRSYERQNQIYKNNISKKGEENTNKVSAKPGTSEHQTGLAIDVSCSSVGCALEESFGNTAEGKWLRKNCYKYGFIIRYPKNKTEITGYSYEPWHIRYVGKNLAKYLKKNKLTLEEYYQLTTVDNAVSQETVEDTDTDIQNEPQMTTAPTPKASITPTEKPVQTEKADAKKTKATKKPKKTKNPKTTQKPSATKKPKATQQPAVTEKPKATKAPVVTAEPEVTEAPEEESSAGVSEEKE